MLHARVYTQEQLLFAEDYEGGNIWPGGGGDMGKISMDTFRQRRPKEDPKIEKRQKKH